MFSKFTFSTIISLFFFFHYLNVTSADEDFLTIYNKCLNGQGACVVLNFDKGYKKAVQTPLHPNNLGECASDRNQSQICLYKDGGGAQISCDKPEDTIKAESDGKVNHVTYQGKSKDVFTTSGDNTSIFTATCYA